MRTIYGGSTLFLKASTRLGIPCDKITSKNYFKCATFALNPYFLPFFFQYDKKPKLFSGEI